MKRIVKLLVWLLVIAIIAVAAAVGGLYWYVTNNDVKDILASAVKRTTGHELYIMGEARMDLFPKPTLYATDIRIPAFNGDNPIFTAQKLDVVAKWGTPPFIWKGLELTTLTADAPTVFLKENKKGLPNWESPVRGREGFAGASSGGSGGNSISSIGVIQLNKLKFTYEGDKSGTNVKVQDLNLNVNGADLTATVINASGKINNQQLTATGTVNMKDGDRPIDVTLNAAGLTAKFKGNIGGEPTGSLALSGNNLRSTLSKFVEPAAVSSLPASNFILSTDITSSGNTKNLNSLKLELGNTVQFNGAVAYTDRGRRSPLFNVNGTFNRLNLTALGICTTSTSSTPTTEWDSTPIDLSFIRSANWHADIALNSISCAGVPINSAKLNAENDGLTVKINNFKASLPKNGKLATEGSIKYGNRIVGDLTTTLSNLPVESFISKAGELVFPLSGTIETKLDGASMKDLMSNLNGSVNLNAKNVILPAQGLEAISLKLSSIMGGARTATADFNAAYTIQKGIAETTAFMLVTKDNFLSIKGEGKVDIGHRSIAYRLTPNAKANGGLFKGGLAIPVSVQGRWHDIKVRPDKTVTKSIGTGIGAAVGGPAGALIGNTVGGVLSGDQNAVGNLIQGAAGFLNKKEEAPAEEVAPEEKPKDPIKDGVENLLKGLF